MWVEVGGVGGGWGCGWRLGVWVEVGGSRIRVLVRICSFVVDIIFCYISLSSYSYDVVPMRHQIGKIISISSRVDMDNDH